MHPTDKAAIRFVQTTILNSKVLEAREELEFSVVVYEHDTETDGRKVFGPFDSPAVALAWCEQRAHAINEPGYPPLAHTVMALWPQEDES